MPRPAPLRSELRAALEPLRLVARSPALRAAPRGSGPVMVLPGFQTTDRSTAPLRRWLRYLGYDAVGWGMGVNRGQLGAVLPTLEGKLQQMGPRPVALVGWSWGGVLARGLGRSVPARVSQVITLGTPIQGGVGNTVFGGRASQADRDASARASHLREAQPLTVPALSIYTRTDGVVAWQASIDPVDGRTEHSEVESSHAGLGLSPAVWLLIAGRLEGARLG
jgi:hypothetical protein